MSFRAGKIVDTVAEAGSALKFEHSETMNAEKVVHKADSEWDTDSILQDVRQGKVVFFFFRR